MNNLLDPFVEAYLKYRGRIRVKDNTFSKADVITLIRAYEYARQSTDSNTLKDAQDVLDIIRKLNLGFEA